MSDNPRVVELVLDCALLREILAGVPASEGAILALDEYVQSEQMLLADGPQLVGEGSSRQQAEAYRVAAYTEFISAWSQIRVILTPDQMRALGY